MTENKLQKTREELAYYYHNELVIQKRKTQISFIIMGEILYNIKEKKLYAEHPHDLEKFEQYLELPDVSLAYSTAMMLILIFKVWVKRLKVKKDLLMVVDYRKLAVLNPIVTENNWEELLEDARILTRYHLKEKYGNKNKKSHCPVQSNVSQNTMECPYYKTYKCPHTDNEVIVQTEPVNIDDSIETVTNEEQWW